MNEIELAESFFPALQDRPIIHKTIGAVLKDTALKSGRNEALVEVKQDGNLGRRWNYETLYKDSLQLAFALSSRFKKGEHIVIWSPNNPEWAGFRCSIVASRIECTRPRLDGPTKTHYWRGVRKDIENPQ